MMPQPTDSRWLRFRLIVAGLLGLAAVSKMTHIPEILASGGLLASRPILLAAIGFEAAVTVYLLIGDAKLSWIIAVGTFTILATFAGYAIMIGQSCNCVSTSIGAHVMLPLDIAVLAVAIWCRPVFERRRRDGLLVPIAVSCALGLLCVWLAHFRIEGTRTADPLEFLLASNMEGAPWPIGSEYHPALSALSTGKWMIVVLRRDCQHCRQLVVTYFADPRTHRAGERTAVFVAGDVRWPFQLDSVSLTPAGNTSISWQGEEPFVASPAIFLVEDGVVVSASDGPEAEQTMQKLHGDFVHPEGAK